MKNGASSFACFVCSLPLLWVPVIPARVSAFLWILDIALFTLLMCNLASNNRTFHALVCWLVVLPCAVPFLSVFSFHGSTYGPIHGLIPQIIALSIMALCLIIYGVAIKFGKQSDARSSDPTVSSSATSSLTYESESSRTRTPILTDQDQKGVQQGPGQSEDPVNASLPHSMNEETSIQSAFVSPRAIRHIGVG